MTDLERIRHSCAHVLATAILRLWPEAQFAAGPPVENGFYYDVELPHRISPEDFAKIEAEMKKEIKANQRLRASRSRRRERSARRWRKRATWRAWCERPATEQVQARYHRRTFPRAKPISLYRNGDFIDLCAGPHVMRTGNIGAFKLTHVASAYYKGDEKNPQLQRIYGTAFKNKTADGRILHHARGGEEARPPQDRQGAGAVHLRRRSSAPACRSGCRAAPRSSRNWRSWRRKRSSPPAMSACGLRTSAREKHVSNERPPAVLRGVDVSADGTRRRRRSASRS